MFFLNIQDEAIMQHYYYWALISFVIYVWFFFERIWCVPWVLQGNGGIRSRFLNGESGSSRLNQRPNLCSSFWLSPQCQVQCTAAGDFSFPPWWWSNVPVKSHFPFTMAFSEFGPLAGQEVPDWVHKGCAFPRSPLSLATTLMTSRWLKRSRMAASILSTSSSAWSALSSSSRHHFFPSTF